MTQQLWGRDTATGECGWFTPVADVPDTNTFATVSGQTITFASGATLTVPLGSTLVGSILTTSDGNSVDLSTLDTDTDTLSLLSGQTINWPNGDSVTIPDGSTILGNLITTSDGNTIDVSTLDTDTLSSLAGQTITWPNGDSITIPNGSTIAGTVITTSDGNTIDLADYASVDTDTFAAVSGNVITFANGDTLEVADVSGSGTAADPYLITDYQGDVATIVVDDDVSGVQILYDNATRIITSTVTEGITVVTDTVSLPSTLRQADLTASLDDTVTPWALTKVVQPSRNSDHTYADLEANRNFAINPTALTKVLTNWLTGISGHDGVSNPNGSLGFASFPIANAAEIPLWNGARFGVDIGQGTVAIPDGSRVGHTLILEFIGGGPFGEVNVTGNFRGILRDTNAVITGHTLINTIIGRATEQLFCRWSGSAWVATTEHRMMQGVNYREHSDGTYSGEGNLPYNPAAFPPFATAPTVVEGTNGTFIFSGGRV